MAAHIAQNDTSPKVELVHLLAAFADEDNGLLAQLKKNTGLYSYGKITSARLSSTARSSFVDL